MRKFIAGIATAGLTVGGLLVASGAPASADTEDCVTKAEFAKVHQYMKKARVTEIFDVPGHRTSYSSSVLAEYQYREYRSCANPRWDTIEVDFRKPHRSGSFWRVEWKYGYWS